MAKGIRRKDDAVYGISAAANYLGCAEATVLNHANAGRLACKRDSSGKRLFAQSELTRFKRANVIRGNRRTPPIEARTARSAS